MAAAAALVAGAAAELENPALAGKTLEGLAKSWDSDEDIRHWVLDSKSLLKWPSSKKVGDITFETLAMNARVVNKVLDIWCPQLSEAKTLILEQVRDEDGSLKNTFYHLPNLANKSSLFLG